MAETMPDRLEREDEEGAGTRTGSAPARRRRGPRIVDRPRAATATHAATHAARRGARRGAGRGAGREGTDDHTAIIAASLGAGALFLLLAREVAGRGGLPVDVRTRRLVRAHRSPASSALAALLWPPGWPGFFFPASVLAARALRRRGERGELVVSAALLGWASHHVVKRFMTRRRPPTRRGRHNYLESFPSGHTTPATAIALVTAHLVARAGLTPRAAATAGAIGLAGTVGLARVHRDAHWLTDVVGGWLLGATVAGMVVVAGERERGSGRLTAVNSWRQVAPRAESGQHGVADS